MYGDCKLVLGVPMKTFVWSIAFLGARLDSKISSMMHHSNGLRLNSKAELPTQFLRT